jgi:integrase
MRRFVRSAGVDVERPCRAIRSPSTVGDLVQSYLDYARRAGTPAAYVARRNAQRLCRIVSLGLGVDARTVSRITLESAITKEVVKTWAEKTLGADPDESARRSVRSMLRQARSMFARPVIAADAYGAVCLPDYTGFLAFVPCADPVVRYRLPDEDFVERFMAAAHGLREERSELYSAFLLVYYTAARPGDAVAARWSWFVHEDLGGGIRRWVIQYTPRPDEAYRPKTAGIVPLPARVVDDLMAMRRPDDPFILPGGSPTARRNLVCRDLAAWMRERGWKTPKAAYELRKLRGSYWRFRYGLDRCHAWMRHSSYATTLRYYADLPRRPLQSELEVGYELDPLAGSVARS